MSRTNTPRWHIYTQTGEWFHTSEDSEGDRGLSWIYKCGGKAHFNLDREGAHADRIRCREPVNENFGLSPR
jgi:hypothetical protein